MILKKELIQSPFFPPPRIGNAFCLPDLAFNAVIEPVLNKYSCSMLKRIRELVLIASLTSGGPGRIPLQDFSGWCGDYLDF